MNNVELSFIDTHIHVADSTQETLDKLLPRVKDEGGGELWLPATSLENSKRNLEVSQESHPHWPRLRPFAGVHPENISTFNAFMWEEYWALAGHNFVGIGEIGLDKRLDSPISAQLEVFDTFMSLAYKEHLPVLIHCVGAHNELLHYLKGRGGKLSRGVIHGACVSLETAKAYLKHGFLLGIGSVFMAPNASKIKKVVSELDASSFITETDWPYMRVHNATDSTCGLDCPDFYSPDALPRQIREMAELRGEDAEALAAVLLANARRLVPKEA